MDKQKIINLANKGLEMVSEMSIENRYKNLLGDMFFEIRKEAINYTRSCESDSEQLVCDEHDYDSYSGGSCKKCGALDSSEAN